MFLVERIEGLGIRLCLIWVFVCFSLIYRVSRISEDVLFLYSNRWYWCIVLLVRLWML